MLTLTEAAALLNLSPITLRLQIRNKKLKAVKRGRDWFVTRTEVERYRRESSLMYRLQQGRRLETTTE